MVIELIMTLLFLCFLWSCQMPPRAPPKPVAPAPIAEEETPPHHKTEKPSGPSDFSGGVASDEELARSLEWTQKYLEGIQYKKRDKKTH